MAARLKKTYSWVGKNKLSAKARARVAPGPFAIALEEVVQECLCWNSIGFWPEWEE
jgi:hypothetical protein